jgi:uncharacterized membrane protein (UPF0136 family)
MSDMKKMEALFISYGALLVLLGAIGWVMSHSMVSFLAGGGSGLALMACGWIWKRGNRVGLYLSAAILLMLCGVFGARYAAQGKMLSLVLFSTSAIALVLGTRAILRKPTSQL